ncbi:MAG: FliH/SctL family protein [Planctomycetota bacterium]
MPVIKNLNPDSSRKSPVALDLGDLRREADRLQSRAKASAQAVLDRANAERERLIADASEVGHRQGFEQGLAEGHEEGRRAGSEEAKVESAEALAQLVQSWDAALALFESQRAAMLAEARREVVEFAVEMAHAVTKRALEVEPERVIDQVGEALRRAVHASNATIVVHPEDVEMVREALPQLLERIDQSLDADVSESDRLERGACVVRLPAGEISATVDGQLQRIVEQLVPERVARDDAE